MEAHPLNRLFICKFNESKAHGRVWVPTDTAIHDLARVFEDISKGRFCDLCTRLEI